MNKTAKEMFEELGFKFKENKETINGFIVPKIINHTITYHNSNGIGDVNTWLTIEFDLIKKEIFIIQDTMSGIIAPTIRLNVLQAINKQVEEMEWE